MITLMITSMTRPTIIRRLGNDDNGGVQQTKYLIVAITRQLTSFFGRSIWIIDGKRRTKCNGCSTGHRIILLIIEIKD